MKELYRIRRGLFCCFLILGFSMASWIVRTPSIRDVLNASTGEIGLILSGFSVGSMTGIFMAGNIAWRMGTPRTILSGLLLALAGLAVLAGGTVQLSSWIAGCGLGMVGFGMAMSEVAVNIQGVQVERGLKKPVLPSLHGCYSLGTVAGAVCGLGLVGWQIPVGWHMLVTSIILLPAVFYVHASVQTSACSLDDSSTKRISAVSLIRSDPRILLAGLIVLSVALAEGAANDWLPLLIVDTHSVPEQMGSLIFVAFALTMTIGRFSGTAILDRYGPAIVIRTCGIIGALGILGVIFSPNLWVAGVAVVFWAMGAALGFPVAMSAGAVGGNYPAMRVSILATVGYTAFLVGPPLLGFIGEHAGLRMSMVLVVSMLIFPIMLARVLHKPVEPIIDS
ncbi:MFS transporter [Vibrio parahaemolyticus]|uniref:MFS transporter n=1 Tax=Vibrio parahaemolyticus TaxID=670 RepID=UPI001EEA3727|nr:MFS transporter [Vibrio parahaemolyticus]MCG6489969.1 MFS transporter [Vibrio parahaemolyticus]